MVTVLSPDESRGVIEYSVATGVSVWVHQRLLCSISGLASLGMIICFATSMPHSSAVL